MFRISWNDSNCSILQTAHKLWPVVVTSAMIMIMIIYVLNIEMLNWGVHENGDELCFNGVGRSYRNSSIHLAPPLVHHPKLMDIFQNTDNPLPPPPFQTNKQTIS